jgi:CDP-6-deoxy-D-xylo-4-hexulose-3-dehydrase
MQAAIGVAQLDKINGFSSARRRNFELLKKALMPLSERLILPEACPNSIPSWFGFLITCEEGVSRNQLVQRLETQGIQTRMLFAGNIIRQPCFNIMRKTWEGYRVAGNLTNTDRVMNSTFWFGVYPGISEETVEYIVDTIKKSIKLA